MNWTRRRVQAGAGGRLRIGRTPSIDYIKSSNHSDSTPTLQLSISVFRLLFCIVYFDSFTAVCSIFVDLGLGKKSNIIANVSTNKIDLLSKVDRMTWRQSMVITKCLSLAAARCHYPQIILQYLHAQCFRQLCMSILVPNVQH